MTRDETIARARQLRQADELEDSQTLLLELLDQHPKDPIVLYEAGGSYDVMGEEKEAIPYYQQAIAAGLQGDDLQECLICLGSCQRNVGDFAEAVETLQTAVKKFPDDNSGKVFLALAYYSDAQEDKSVQLLIDLLLKTTSDENILDYADALDFYKDHLDDVWDD